MLPILSRDEVVISVYQQALTEFADPKSTTESLAL
jgi:hypothetical protein